MDCPPRWELIVQHLERAMRELVCGRSGTHNLMDVKPTWDELTRHYFAEEFLYRPSVDAAARHIAKHGVAPPDISSESVWYLAFRLHCALDFVGMIYPPQASSAPFSDIPKSWTEQRVIEWLLIDLWIRRFDHWLKLQAIGHFGPFAFYGIEPANPAVPS